MRSTVPLERLYIYPSVVRVRIVVRSSSGFQFRKFNPCCRSGRPGTEREVRVTRQEGVRWKLGFVSEHRGIR